MRSLDEAWGWYKDTHECLTLFRRLGDRYWNDLPWSGNLGRDDRFRTVEAPIVVEKADQSLNHLDDLAVLVLFSVFESEVRGRVLDEIRLERLKVEHRLVLRILDTALDGIEQGSFFRVLEFYEGEGLSAAEKDTGSTLVEAVNQVRKYRNWVAHGRRASRPDNVDPEAAYQRLRRFLDALAGQGTDA